MKKFSQDIDRRQRVNLSDEAFDVIESDRYTFGNEKTLSYSGIISQIFLLFALKSSAMSDNTILIEEYLARKPGRAQKKCPSLQNDVLDFFERPDINEIIKRKVFNSSPGKFIKAVIEEYAEKPFLEREKICFSGTVKNINDGIKLKKRKLLRIITGNNAFIVRPYAIMTDKQSTYNYLVCIIDKTINAKLKKIVSLRLSRIKSVEVLHDSEFEFSDSEIDEIKKMISEKGVQFLRGELQTIRVEFTHIGLNMYRDLLFQRPQMHSSEENIYTFKCTPAQAEYYFFKFGAEAKIIEPDELKQKIVDMYVKAMEAYTVN